MNDDPIQYDSPASPQPIASAPQIDNISAEVAASFSLTCIIGGCLFVVFFFSVIFFNRDAQLPISLQFVFAGLLYGAVLSVVMFAAIWSALGGGHFAHRLGFAALWNVGVLVTLVGSLAIPSGPAPIEMIAGAAMMLGAAWFLPQAPLWALRFFLGIRFDIPGRVGDAKANQFGLRHLFIFTSIIAVLLGAGRAAISWLKIDAPNLEGFLSTSYVLTSAVVLSVSLLIAALLPRFAIYGVLLMLGLITLVGYWEVSLLGLMTNMRFGPDRSFFVWQKLCLAGWLLVFAFFLRRHDFRFIIAHRQRANVTPP